MASRVDSVRCPFCFHFGCPSQGSHSAAKRRVRYRKCNRCKQTFRTEQRLVGGRDVEVDTTTGNPVIRPNQKDDPSKAGVGYVRPDPKADEQGETKDDDK